MKYKIPDADIVAKQAERVLGFVTMETIKKGYVEASEVMKEFDLPTALLIQIRGYLIAAGKIEEVP